MRSSRACLPRAARRIDPHVNTLDQFLRKRDVVVLQEYNMGAYIWSLDEVRPSAHELLALPIPWMRLAGHDELNGSRGAGEQTRQTFPVVQQQVRAFVFRETTREAESQGVRIEHVLRLGDGFCAGAAMSQLSRQSSARVADEISALLVAYRPQSFIAQTGDGLGMPGHFGTPTALAAGLGPETISPG